MLQLRLRDKAGSEEEPNQRTDSVRVPVLILLSATVRMYMRVHMPAFSVCACAQVCGTHMILGWNIHFQ